MKRILAIVMLLSMLLLISCADVTTPKGTVEYMVEHMRRGNVEEAMKVLSDPEDAQPFLEAHADPVQAVVSKKTFEKAEIKIDEAEIQGDKATVSVETKTIDGPSMANLKERLDQAKSGLSADLSEDELKQELEKAADEINWEDFSTMKQHIQYHLSKEGDRWKILAKETEINTINE